MSQDTQPKFITFMQCMLGKNQWKSISIDKLTPEKAWIMERMSRFQSIANEARANILDMSYKYIKLKFKEGSIIGVGSNMFYCDAQDVTDTKVDDAQPEYNLR
jgi:hypothetical protein